MSVEWLEPRSAWSTSQMMTLQNSWDGSKPSWPFFDRGITGNSILSFVVRDDPHLRDAYSVSHLWPSHSDTDDSHDTLSSQWIPGYLLQSEVGSIVRHLLKSLRPSLRGSRLKSRRSFYNIVPRRNEFPCGNFSMKIILPSKCAWDKLFTPALFWD
jgi:hypothetical protein